MNYHRQRDIFNPEESQKSVQVIGCGTIGSWVTLGLHKLGVRDVTLYDFDTVEDVNVPSQNFTESDVGGYKAEILGVRYGYKYSNDEYTGTRADITILAVDSLEARRAILATLGESLVIDGRMGGEGYEVHIGRACDIRVPQEASEDLCTAKGIVYVSMGIAAEMVALAKHSILGDRLSHTIYRDYRRGDTLTVKRKV